MSKRVLGYIFVAAAIVGAVAAFGSAKAYVPQGGIVASMKRAYVWTDCKPTYKALINAVPKSCWTEDLQGATTITLYDAVTGALVLALVGVGLIVFGKSST